MGSGIKERVGWDQRIRTCSWQGSGIKDRVGWDQGLKNWLVIGSRTKDLFSWDYGLRKQSFVRIGIYILLLLNPTHIFEIYNMHYR